MDREEDREEKRRWAGVWEQMRALGVEADGFASDCARRAVEMLEPMKAVSVEDVDDIATRAAKLARDSRALLLEVLEAHARARALTIPPAGVEPVTVEALEVLQRAAFPDRAQTEARLIAAQCVAAPLGFCSALELERARFAVNVAHVRTQDGKRALRRYADALALLRRAPREPSSTETDS